MSYEVWPGPMEGVAQEAFVRTANELRLIERWMTPFCRLSCALPHTGKLRSFLAPFAAGNLPVTVQLMGVDPELIAAAAAIFADLGAAGINLNFGCPSNRVTAGNAGGGAWKHPDDILRICAACRKVLPPHMRSPLQPLPKKKEKPRKGTRRWRAQQEKEKKLAKRAAIRNVYALLEAI